MKEGNKINKLNVQMCLFWTVEAIHHYLRKLLQNSLSAWMWQKSWYFPWIGSIVISVCQSGFTFALTHIVRSENLKYFDSDIFAIPMKFFMHVDFIVSHFNLKPFDNILIDERFTTWTICETGKIMIILFSSFSIPILILLFCRRKDV